MSDLTVVTIVPQTTPQKVASTAINATAMIVTWQLPNRTREDLRGKILGFQVKKKELVLMFSFLSDEEDGLYSQPTNTSYTSTY